jgi:hypothetical protein
VFILVLVGHVKKARLVCFYDLSFVNYMYDFSIRCKTVILSKATCKADGEIVSSKVVYFKGIVK